jgi:hypothetical protein
MQKCQIPKFLFDPLWTSMFSSTLVPQGDLGSKVSRNKKFLKFNFRKGQFCSKMLHSNFVFDILWTSQHIWGALFIASGCRSKNYKEQKFLAFNWGKGSI